MALPGALLGKLWDLRGTASAGRAATAGDLRGVEVRFFGGKGGKVKSHEVWGCRML